MNSPGNYIDLNADVGERSSALADGFENQLLALVSSANIACGGHAGDASTMKAVVRLCLAHGVSIGAHPGYPDWAGFGRHRLDMDPSDLRRSIQEQVGNLLSIAGDLGARVRHVKPHGALYNAAAKNSQLAQVIAEAILLVDKHLILVGLAGSLMLDVWRAAGFAVIAEAFADRPYEADGHLRSRSLPDSLLINPLDAAQQALSIARDHTITATNGTRLTVHAQTLCVHGDTPSAIAVAREIRAHLSAAGISVQTF